MRGLNMEKRLIGSLKEELARLKDNNGMHKIGEYIYNYIKDSSWDGKLNVLHSYLIKFRDNGDAENVKVMTFITDGFEQGYFNGEE